MSKLIIPQEIEKRLEAGAHLVVSVSGGKDSDTMALELHDLYTRRGWGGDFMLIHADVGRMEWQQSLPHCHKLADRLGVPLFVVRHPRHDLLDGIIERMGKRPDAPPFPSASCRWCTSDFKRTPIDKWLRNAFKNNADVVVTIGYRRAESAARAKQPEWRERVKPSAPTKNRRIADWHPILDYEMGDILETCQRFDWELHPAYALGNERVSCALCILGSKNDLANGADHNPELYRALVQIERDSGFTFQAGFALADLRPDLLD